MASSLEIVDSAIADSSAHGKEKHLVSAFAPTAEAHNHESQLPKPDTRLQARESIFKSAGESARTQFQLEDHPIDSERSIRVSSHSSSPL